MPWQSEGGQDFCWLGYCGEAACKKITHQLVTACSSDLANPGGEWHKGTGTGACHTHRVQRPTPHLSKRNLSKSDHYGEINIFTHWHLFGCLLCTRHYAKSAVRIFPFGPHHRRWAILFQFYKRTKRDQKAEGAHVTCPKSQSWEGGSLDTEHTCWRLAVPSRHESPHVPSWQLAEPASHSHGACGARRQTTQIRPRGPNHGTSRMRR